MNIIECIESVFQGPYKRKARWYPTCLSMLPFVVLCSAVLRVYVHFPRYELVKAILNIAVSLLACCTAAVYLLSSFVRECGRKLQDSYFSHSQYLPTTEFLLWSNNEFSVEYKTRLHDAVAQDFGICLPSRDEEQKDVRRARKLIAEAVDLIRPRVKDGVRLLQYNIRFGFFRNLAASSRIVGLPGSIVCLFLSLCWIDDRGCLIIEAFLLVIYLLVVCKTNDILDWYGEEYARVLFAEYMEGRRKCAKQGQGVQTGVTSGRPSSDSMTKGLVYG